MRASKTGESTHFYSLAWAFVREPKSHELAQMGMCVPFMRVMKTGECTFVQARISLCHSTKNSYWLKWQFVCHSCEQQRLVSLHICTVSHEPSPKYQNLMCWLKWQFVYHSCEQRRLLSLHSLARDFVTVPKSKMLAKMAICVPFMATANTGESVHLHRLACAFVTVRKSHELAKMAICVSFMRVVKTGESAQSRLKPSSEYQNHMCWLKWVFVCRSCEQRRLVSLHSLAWAFVTVPKSYVLAQMGICVPFMRAA